MKSPCTKICQINRESRLCLGCFRTLDEIATWGSMSDAQRDRIMTELGSRQNAADIARSEVPS